MQNELATVRQEAAMAHKLEGERLLTVDNKQRARQAYHHFVQANSFQAGVVSTKVLDNAQDADTVIVVLKFANIGRFFRSYNTDEVFNTVRNNFKETRYRFMRVVELDGAPQDIIKIEMDDAHIGGVDFSKNVYELKKEDVYMGEATTNSGELLKVYGKVTADYIEYCKTINSRAHTFCTSFKIIP